jgi:glucose/arabinose dehydrogenase
MENTLGIMEVVMVRRSILPALIIAATMLPQTYAARAESVNAGERPYSATRPFQVQAIATFNTPWAIAFLPDNRMLVTERGGALFVVTPQGEKTPIDHVPQVVAEGQNGLLDVALAPDFASTRDIYLTYIAKGERGTRLVLAHAKFTEVAGKAQLDDLSEIWRQTPEGGGGQPGGIIRFDSSGKHLFLTVGDRMQPKSAQDPNAARGKLLRLNLNGTIPADNPHAGAGGIVGETWTTGHRNPYGLAFAPDGKLWLHEMGPKGGDELNLIEPGKNYGWPIVSNGDNYNGTPIPRHSTRPEFTAPLVYWTPVIAPAGMAFYEGALFPAWKGSILVGGLKSHALVRVAFRADGQPDEVDRFDMGARIRDVAVASDGAVWLLEDGPNGRLLRLTPK